MRPNGNTAQIIFKKFSLNLFWEFSKIFLNYSFRRIRKNFPKDLILPKHELFCCCDKLRAVLL